MDNDCCYLRLISCSRHLCKGVRVFVCVYLLNTEKIVSRTYKLCIPKIYMLIYLYAFPFHYVFIHSFYLTTDSLVLIQADIG